MKKIYLVSLSGGKDSQASLLYILNHYPKKLIRAHFCDTGWEHPSTYEHIEYLKKRLDIHVDILKSDKYKDFKDLCMQKGIFPTRRKRYCTMELKIYPALKYIKKWLDDGYRVINVVGVRRAESKKRENAPKWCTEFCGEIPKSKKRAKEYYKQSNSFITFQPIVDWSVEQVYDYNTKNGTKNNPLYRQGFDRVGCFPCINARQQEIALLPTWARKRVAKLEQDVRNSPKCKKKTACFFYRDKAPTPIEKIYKSDKYQYNTLKLELGCINRYGKCE